MLLENEQQKIADLEKKHKVDMELWHDKIEPMKQVSEFHIIFMFVCDSRVMHVLGK